MTIQQCFKKTLVDKYILCLFQIQVHGNDLTSFYEQVPKEVLPTEYGGKAGSIAENWGMTYDDFIFKAKET
jgi:hypothetical protein